MYAQFCSEITFLVCALTYSEVILSHTVIRIKKISEFCGVRYKTFLSTRLNISRVIRINILFLENANSHAFLFYFHQTFWERFRQKLNFSL